TLSSSSASQQSPWNKIHVSSFSKPCFASTCETVNGVSQATIPIDIINDSLPLWNNYIIGKLSALDKPSKIDAQYFNPKLLLKSYYWHIYDVPLVVQEWNPRSSSNTFDLTALLI
ncbi:unnamed protein product, partial [Brassica rapa]